MTTTTQPTPPAENAAFPVRVPPVAPCSAIRIATPADLPYVQSLAKKFTAQLGFIPTVGLAKYIEWNCVYLSQENTENAGYILGRRSLRHNALLRPIFQAAVQLDAQRRHHAEKMLLMIEAEAVNAGQVGIQANCAEDIEANDFWRAMHFDAICTIDPKNTRGRKIICWRKLISPTTPSWWTTPPLRAGYRAAHANTTGIDPLLWSPACLKSLNTVQTCPQLHGR